MNTPKTLITTDDMETILDLIELVGPSSTSAIAFCTSIAEWRVEIDIQDMADAGLVTLSKDDDYNTIATIL